MAARDAAQFLFNLFSVASSSLADGKTDNSNKKQKRRAKRGLAIGAVHKSDISHIDNIQLHIMDRLIKAVEMSLQVF